MTTICVVDAEGAILKRDVAPSEPDALAKWLARHVPTLVRVNSGDTEFWGHEFWGHNTN
jgi:hypothetical protein